MKWEIWRKKLIYVVPALVIFVLLYSFTHIQREPEHKQQVQILALGDSVFGLVRDETGIPAMLGEALGKTIYNGGLGGTCFPCQCVQYKIGRAHV